MNINKVIIAGRLTAKPELRSIGDSQVSTTSFSIATNRVWKDKNGAKQEVADFHNIVVFGKQAESCAQYLEKGQVVMVEGRLQTRSWEGTDGKKNYKTEVVSDRVQFGERARGASAAKKDEHAQAPAPEEVSTIEYPEENINIDDIPF